MKANRIGKDRKPARKRAQTKGAAAKRSGRTPKPTAPEPDFVPGWILIADNDAGTLAKWEGGYLLRTNRYDERGEIQWPCNEFPLSEAEAREWVRCHVTEPAFPGDREARLAADVKQRAAARETGNFTPLVVGMALRPWKVETLAEYVCATLFHHAPWLATTIERASREKEDARLPLRVAEAGEALALCAAVWTAMQVTRNPWRRSEGDEGIDIESFEGQYHGRPDLRDLAGLPDFLHPTAPDVLSVLVNALHWCWHDLASEALRDLPPHEAVELLDALCVLESWAAEVDGLATDFDREGETTRLQLAAAAARRAHYFPKAA